MQIYSCADCFKTVMHMLRIACLYQIYIFSIKLQPPDCGRYEHFFFFNDHLMKLHFSAIVSRFLCLNSRFFSAAGWQLTLISTHSLRRKKKKSLTIFRDWSKKVIFSHDHLSRIWFQRFLQDNKQTKCTLFLPIFYKNSRLFCAIVWRNSWIFCVIVSLISWLCFSQMLNKISLFFAVVCRNSHSFRNRLTKFMLFLRVF